MDGGESRKTRWSEGLVRARELEESRGEERGAEQSRSRGEARSRAESSAGDALAERASEVFVALEPPRENLLERSCSKTRSQENKKVHCTYLMVILVIYLL